MRLLALCAVLFAGLCGSPALAQESPDTNCFRLYGQEPTALEAGRVIGSGPVSLLDSSALAKCRAEPASCSNGGDKLLPGMEVAMTTATPGFVCVVYSRAAHEEAYGWLPAENIERIGVKDSAKLAAWVGTWHSGFPGGTGSIIKVEVAADRLHLEGESVWKGPSDIENVGSFKTDALPVGRTVSYEDTNPYAKPDQCKVVLARIGDLLAVEDNMNCGGTNVSFTGFYRRGE